MVSSVGDILRWLGFRREDKEQAALQKYDFVVGSDYVRWTCQKCGHQQRSPSGHSRNKERCSRCGREAPFKEGLPQLPRRLGLLPAPRLAFVTRATAEEVEAAVRGKTEFFCARTKSKRRVRNRLVYHMDWDCALAHRDYEDDGVLLAYNSGVVQRRLRFRLKLCKGCGQNHLDPCPRCGGHGHIPRWNHVENGICFLCDGAGLMPEGTSRELSRDVRRNRNLAPASRRERKKKTRRSQRAQKKVTPTKSQATEPKRERLRRWRLKQAKARGVPAYCILPNATLRRVVDADPRTLGELRGIRGIGPVTVKQYGQQILDILSDNSIT